jgi:hypothetical protein
VVTERDAYTPDPEPFIPPPCFEVTFLNPEGDRHLAFEDGYFYRLRADGQHQRIHAGIALLLRPSDAGQMLRIAAIYMMRLGSTERTGKLCDELVQGVQRLAEVAGKANQTR